MDAVTYPERGVISFINEMVVPVRVPHNHETLASKFAVKWTPTLVTLDSEGIEHYRTVGFLDPGELIPSLLLGKGKVDFDRDNFEAAIRAFSSVINDYPASDSTPEAVFLLGVSRYKNTHDPKALKDAYERLGAGYSDSVWAKRASPYRLL
jgi:hypothetical protein